MEFLRRRLGLILRTLVSVALIGCLLRMNIHWGRVWADVRTMDPRWLLLSFCAFLPVICVVSWRWKILLAVQEVRLPFFRLFELNMIAQFFSAFLVGTTGGDVVKIFYVARNVPKRKTAVGFTVLVDRVIGLMALLLFGVVLSFTQLPLLFSQHYPQLLTELFYLFAFGGVVASTAASLGPFVLKRPALRAWLKRLPFVHRGAPLFEAYERTARAFGTNLLALVCSLPSHVCTLLMGYAILRAMDLHPNLLAFCSILAIVNMLIALPVSISGVGVREQLFILFFALIGINKDHAFTFSITFFFMNLLWSLAGGAFYFLYRHETHEPAPIVAPSAPAFSK